jgi:hypothetical protein
MSRQIFRYFLAGSLVFLDSPAYCAAALESQTTSLEKSYQNGDSMKLACVEMPVCKLDAKVAGRRQSVVLDFGSVGLRPTLQGLRLFRMSNDGAAFSLEVEIECRRVDEDMVDLNTTVSARCVASLHVLDGQVHWSSVQVLPISNVNLYKKL